MTSHEQSDNGHRGAAGTGRSDSIARLVRLAGPRPAVPDDVRERVHRAVADEWRRTYRQSRVRRWGIPFALAAVVLLGIMLALRQPPPAVAVPVATVAAVGPGAGQAPRSRGDKVFAGDPITTGDRGLALALTNGFSVRVAAGSTLVFDGVEDLSLVEGRVYADTGRAIYDNRSITIRTGLGTAKDVGTQFAVALVDGRMQVAVREGRVDVSNPGFSYTAKAGQMLTLGRAGEADLDRLSPHDGAWNWATDLAPAFDIENRSLLEFLQWVARETGKELVFESDRARMAAMGTRPHGSVADFTPIEALDSVLRTTRFEYRVDAGRILIAESAESR